MEISAHVDIAAPAEVAWRVIGERFGDIAEWTSTLTASSLDSEVGVGAVRTCHFQPDVFSSSGILRERLLGFDRTAMTLTYEGLGLPFFLRGAVNRWSVTRVSSEVCRVESRARLDLRGVAVVLTPLMRPMIRRMGEKLLSELAVHVEAVANEKASATARIGA